MASELDPKFLRLPKWAQKHIIALEGQVRRNEQTIESLRRDVALDHDKTESNTFINHFSGAPEQPLGRDPYIRFRLNGKKDSWDYVEVYVSKDEKIVIHGGRGLQVQPVSGNVVYVRNKED